MTSGNDEMLVAMQLQSNIGCNPLVLKWYKIPFADEWFNKKVN